MSSPRVAPCRGPRHESASRFRADGILRVENAADLAQAIVEAERAGSIGMAYLFRALRDQRCCLLPVLPETSASALKAFMRQIEGRPSIITIGDDDYLDRGPPAWGQAGRIARWSKAAMVHATGAELGHYESLIEAAQLVKRVVLIECSTVTAPAWLELFRGMPHQPGVLFLRPHEGQHPLPLDRSAIQ